jgi:hypothetical protein
MDNVGVARAGHLVVTDGAFAYPTWTGYNVGRKRHPGGQHQPNVVARRSIVLLITCTFSYSKAE